MAEDVVLAAERVVLGTCMAEVGAIETVTALLSAGDFRDPRHEVLFTYLVASWSADEPVEPVAIADKLRAASSVKKAGGLPYLHTLVAAALPAVNVTHYATIVATAATRRTLARAGMTLAAAAEADDPNARRRLVDDALALVVALGTASGHEPDSWVPVDLEPFLTGQVVRPTPSIGMSRDDGLQLIYRGKEHVVIGEMEAGKGWVLCLSAVAEIEAGNHVVYVHYEEADAADTVERLLLLGLTQQQIRKLFRFVGPHEPVTPARLAALLEPAPALVIHDGVNEAMSLHRWAIREEDGAASFRRHLVAPCLRVGTATCAADHVTKNRETRDRYGIGSVHKGNGLSGSLILLENVEPFGRGQRGRSHVYVTKDRPGHLRRSGRADAKIPGKTYLGELVVDDTGMVAPHLVVGFYAPKAAEQAESTSDWRVESRREAMYEADRDVLAVVTELRAQGKVANLNAVAAKSPYGKGKTSEALTRLVLDQKLTETKEQNSRVFDLAP